MNTSFEITNTDFKMKKSSDLAMFLYPYIQRTIPSESEVKKQFIQSLKEVIKPDSVE